MRKLKIFSIFVVLFVAMLASCNNKEVKKDSISAKQQISADISLEKQLENINTLIKDGKIPIVESKK